MASEPRPRHAASASGVTLAPVLALTLAASACSSETGGGASALPEPTPSADNVCFSALDCPFGETCVGGRCVESAPEPTAPPSTARRALRPPLGGKNYLFVLAPEDGALVRIDPNRLSVISIEVGTRPSALALVPDSDIALALDPPATRLAIVRATEAGNELVHVALRAPYTDLAISPDGRYALAYFGRNAWTPGEDEEPLAPEAIHAKAAIVDLDAALLRETLDAVEVPVDQRITEVFFRVRSDTPPLAVLVGRRQIARIDLAARSAGDLPGPPVSVALSGAITQRLAERTVRASPDGAWLLLHSPREPALHVVDVDGASRSLSPLPAPPRDSSFSADAQKAYILFSELEGSAALLPLSVPGGLRDPGARVPVAIDDGEPEPPTVEALAFPEDAGNLAVLYGNDRHEESWITFALDAEVVSVRRRALSRSPHRVYLAPGGLRAVVIAQPSDDPEQDDPVEAAIDRSDGYSLVDVGSGAAIPELTELPPTHQAFGPEGKWAALVIPEGLTRSRLHLVDLERLVLHGALVLPGLAWHLGVVAAQEARPLRFHVTLEHPSGRITFVAPESLEVRTTTGYLLPR